MRYRWRPASRPTKLLHMMLQQALHLAVDSEITAIEVHEALPFRVAVANCERVRPAVKRIARIDHMRPAIVPLRKQDDIDIAADPHVSFFGAHRLGTERDLPGCGDDLR